jgi:uncharacterized protein YbjT (DUF2867 family)
MTVNPSVQMTVNPARLVLLTGASGYVGGRLLRVMEQRGERIRCLARRPEALLVGAPTTEVVTGDVLDLDSLRPALAGVDVAYYLVHSMGAPGSFEEQDRTAAANFATAARAAGVRRIVYLGGLGSESRRLSDHLSSRQEVGRILRESGVQTIELRASIVIGSGSLSFELVRALVERLPVMITPRWVRTIAQPIAIEDVLAYLVESADLPASGNEVFEIGGSDRVSYEGLMREYGRQRGLDRVMVPIPFLTARLSSLWLGLVTPVYARVGRKLIESLPNESVVEDRRALEVFSIRPRGHREAIARALANEDRSFAETRWSDALSSGGVGDEGRGRGHGRRFVDSRVVRVPLPAASAFEPIRRIGGDAGWYYGTTLWRLRGLVDLLVGGVGLRRGRRDPELPSAGSTIDFWRVEAYEPDRLLRLRAEMRMPGRAWLQFEVDEDASGSTVRQTAIFDPQGVLGLAYWYALLPLHGHIFAGMVEAIRARAVEAASRR